MFSINLIYKMLLFIINIHNILSHSHSHSHSYSHDSYNNNNNYNYNYNNHDYSTKSENHYTSQYNSLNIIKGQQVLISYFMINSFIDIIDNTYNYNNDKNCTTYNIYYYKNNNENECIYYNYKQNKLNYTIINYSNVTIINNTNTINNNIINGYYCKKKKYFFNYYIIITIIYCISCICCLFCICCQSNTHYNKTSLF